MYNIITGQNGKQYNMVEPVCRKTEGKVKQMRGIDMKRNNRGMSLVEVIIVVAILSIVAGGITMGIGFITGKPADECANKLRAALQSNRTTTMGKLSAKLEICVEDDGIYIKETIGTAGESSAKVNRTRIGDAGIEIKYAVSGGSGYIDLPVGSSLEISFNRSSGAFNPLPGGGYCTEIVISKGNTVKTLKLYNLTGKIELQ